MNCGEFQSILATEPLDILNEQERDRLNIHRRECEACRINSQELKTVYELLGDENEEAAFNPDSLWSGIKQNISRNESQTSAITVVNKSTKKIVIALACSYCHDSLTRGEASYCASCLAPHHTDCFQSHGRCSAMGCEETLTVKPMSVGVSVPEKRVRSTTGRSRKVFLSVVGLIGLGTLATAGLIGHEFIEAQEREDARRRAAALIARSDAQNARAAMKRAIEAQRAAEMTREVQEQKRRIHLASQQEALLKARLARKEMEGAKNDKVRALQDLRAQSLALEEALKAAKASEAKISKLGKEELESEQARIAELESLRESLEKQQYQLRQQVQDLMGKMPTIEIWKSRFGKKVINFKVEQLAFLDALFELETLLNLTIDIQPNKSYPKISLDARNRPWREVLEAMVNKAGAELEYVSPRCISIRPARMSTRDLPAQSRQQRILELGRQLGRNMIVCPDVLGFSTPLKKGQPLLAEFNKTVPQRHVYRMGDTYVVSAKKLRLYRAKNYKTPAHPFVMRAEIRSLTTVKLSDTVSRICDRISHESGGVPIKVLSDRNPKIDIRVHKATWRELLLLVAHKSRMKIFESPHVITLVDGESTYVEAREVPLRLLLKGLNQLNFRQCEIAPIIQGHVSVSLRSNDTQSFLSALCEAFELASKRTERIASSPFKGSVIRYSTATERRTKIQKSKFETVPYPANGEPFHLLLQGTIGQGGPNARNLAILSGQIYQSGEKILNDKGSEMGHLRIGNIKKDSVLLLSNNPGTRYQDNVQFLDLELPGTR